MKDFFLKIWNWIVSQLDKIHRSRLYQFIAGLIIAAFFAIVLNMPFCIWPVFFIGFGKEFFGLWLDKNFDWLAILAAALGGLVIQLFVII